ncbi:hypothetical protein [Myroides odoratimimus]|uniref:hypothetical protein n=1 Tax=Myroides odoratimimus TaxID=76832 RepID=UPI00257615C8|nr:hypothetical protein [Myroides odoratimimus]MDM1529026.1 hypothetical protein [Myroides odoratimimus]
MIKDNLKYDTVDNCFYLQTPSDIIILSQEDLLSINIDISKQKNGLAAQDIVIDKRALKFEYFSKQPSYIRVTVNKIHLCTTDKADDFHTFTSHGTLTMFKKLEF